MEAVKTHILHSWKEFIAKLLAFGILPRRQFRRLMISVTVLGLALLSAHVYLFFRVESHTIFTTDLGVATHAPSVDEKKLTAVLERFENKALIRDTALQVTPVVIDPTR